MKTYIQTVDPFGSLIKRGDIMLWNSGEKTVVSKVMSETELLIKPYRWWHWVGYQWRRFCLWVRGLGW